MKRDHIKLRFCVKTVPVKQLWKTCEEQLSDQNSKIIIYTNLRTVAEKTLGNLLHSTAAKSKSPYDFTTIHGETTLMHKSWAINEFTKRITDASASDDFNVRVMIATDSAECGIDAPDCRTVICMGLPPSMESFRQKAGRIRHKHILDTTKPDVCEILICMSSYLQLLQRCYMRDIRERKGHLKKLNEMLNFAVILDS